VRVHHFARQLASPFPLLAAIGARTSRIEIGTAVIDMRYENPLYMAEDAAAADLARRHTDVFRAAIAGAGVAMSNPQMTGVSQPLAIEPRSPGLPDRIWWGAGTRATAVWAAEQGMNLMSSTLLTEETGASLADLQAEQIQLYRDAWNAAGHDREPRVSISRSILPIIDDETEHYFGLRAQADGQDQVGHLDGGLARFGRSYIGAPDKIADELAQDAAVRAADTILVTVPNQLGVDFNARILESIVRDIRPHLDR
jgi:alkanesulfonate monooxygenase SsuD/methylene tetrahydromethanopterin reductase-like flavin-dependent oxidoreductase (luciferase family)